MKVEIRKVNLKINSLKIRKIYQKKKVLIFTSIEDQNFNKQKNQNTFRD